MTTWERAGQAGIDSGTLMLVDPCYAIIDASEEPYYPFASYRGENGFIKELERQDRAAGVYPQGVQSHYQLVNQYGANSAVAITLGGDGPITVYIERDEQGHVLAVMARVDGRDPHGKPEAGEDEDDG